MEHQDHIATLCAAGTVGIAATGLALGVQTKNESTHANTLGKRKWPGASSLKSTPTVQSSLPSRRVVSQPATSTTHMVLEKHEHARTPSLFRRQDKRDVRTITSNGSVATDSRGSSMNRSGMFRPRTADTRSTSERRDPSTSSSWLKRISTISSPRASSPSGFSSNLDSTPQSTISIASDNKSYILPNKLVKRSTSQRALSNDQAKGTFLRRPATSHQRSATVQEWSSREISFSTPATPYLSSENEPIWRPFFEKGYTRKRQTPTNTKEAVGPRTISASNARRPILMLGSQVEPVDIPDDRTEGTLDLSLEPRTMSTGRQRLRRSFSSVQRAARRRHFTDPTVKLTTEAVNGTITPAAAKQSPLSPTLQTSPFDPDLTPGTPSFSSSPSLIPVRHRFSFRKRQSTAPSDPTTISSDNDTRIFTDDDSMDFQSDTAYDSLTTRATGSSHSAIRPPKLDTVFNGPQAANLEETDATLARLVQNATLTDDISSHYPNQQSDQLRGMGIGGLAEQEEKMDVIEETTSVTTPIKSRSSFNEDHSMTPIPNRLQYFGLPVKSSPPVPTAAVVNMDVGTPEFVVRPRLDEDDVEDIDWSPKSENRGKQSTSTLRANILTFPPTDSSSPSLPQNDFFPEFADEEESELDKRQSTIFDWSEHQKTVGDGLGSMLVRPKTVHGKQGNDGSRSRSSGRKGPSQMHMRSQSVPTNRDPNAEPTPLSTTKFGTWGLGHKPVSEEWSDDFEFDDPDEADEEILPHVSNGAVSSSNGGTLRGVKVPQAIMDRQASVHVQFSQVQEFMLLVEELKSLRARGAALHLFDTHSPHLWEDAESIIDLATNNEDEDEDEDDPIIRPSSPTSSDIFADEISAITKTSIDKPIVDDVKKQSAAYRSMSSPSTTPQHGRPRGESLAQAKNFLQSIHHTSRSGFDSSPMEFDKAPPKKLPFDTPDLKELVLKSGAITRALKDIVRRAEGLSISPNKTPPRSRDPAFSQIFNAPDASPCPPFRKPGLPKSHSASNYLMGSYPGNTNHPNVPTSPNQTAIII